VDENLGKLALGNEKSKGSESNNFLGNKNSYSFEQLLPPVVSE
jgi:hypothetical protein